MDRLERRAERRQTLEDILKLWDVLNGEASDVRKTPIADCGNWTEDGAKTEFDWKLVGPFELVRDDTTMDQESVRSPKYTTKLWNGQGTA